MGSQYRRLGGHQDPVSRALARAAEARAAGAGRPVRAGRGARFRRLPARQPVFYGALFHLAWLRTASGLERVNWRDMETEELGSVYESLLELVPNLSGPSGFGFIDGGRARAQDYSAATTRRTRLVQALLDETLDPLVAERTKGKDGQAAIDALLDLRIIDPACGSGHFLLAAARRLAVKCAELDKPGAAPTPRRLPPLAARGGAALPVRRRQEPHGHRARQGGAVDRDRGARQAAVVPRRTPALRRCPARRLRPRRPASRAFPTRRTSRSRGTTRRRRRMEEAQQGRARCAQAGPVRLLRAAARGAGGGARAGGAGRGRAGEVEAKAERFRALLAGPDRYRMEVACDLYCAAFLMPKTEGPRARPVTATEFIPTSRDVWDKLQGRPPARAVWRGSAVTPPRPRARSTGRWSFPQVFFPGPGTAAWLRSCARQPAMGAHQAAGAGVLRRPRSRDRKGTEQGRAPKVDRDARRGTRRIGEAHAARRVQGSQARRRGGERVREDARRSWWPFRADGLGDVNTYALFAELFATMARRAGVIVPTGIATDATTAPFFAHLVQKQRLAALIDFENREALFPAVDSRMKFAILTIAEQIKSPRFSFFLTNTGQIGSSERRFSLSPTEITAINPNTHTAPVFRSKADAELTKQIYARVPVLIDDNKGKVANPWGLKFHTRIWHMAEDAEWFKTAFQLTENGASRHGANWITRSKSEIRSSL